MLFREVHPALQQRFDLVDILRDENDDETFVWLSKEPDLFGNWRALFLRVEDGRIVSVRSHEQHGVRPPWLDRVEKWFGW
jgi:hypothetical protein